MLTELPGTALINGAIVYSVFLLGGVTALTEEM